MKFGNTIVKNDKSHMSESNTENQKIRPGTRTRIGNLDSEDFVILKLE